MTTREDQAWSLLQEVMDPEVPQISVVDLGIVRSVTVDSDSEVDVVLTPTYSGCPATEVIEQSVAEALRTTFNTVTIHTTLNPPWTTDWMTERGRDNLKAAGIAPPPTEEQRREQRPPSLSSTMRTIAIVGDTASSTPSCPRCNSEDVEKVSQFGSTACKSLWKCRACLEPFDHFKGL